MAEKGVALHRGLRGAPCSDVPQRNLGRPQGYSRVKMGENNLSRCTNDVNRHVIRVTPLVDDSYLRLAGSHMARFASWCEREEAHMCWTTVWKASSVIHAACFSGRKVGLFRPFRSLIDNSRAWLLPEGKSAQRYSAPWLEWMSQSLSILCWLEEYTLDTRGNKRQQLLASRRSKYLPERVRTGFENGRIHPDALTDTAERLTRQLLGPLFQAPPDEGIVYVLCGRSAECVGSTQACRLGPRRATRRIGGTLPRFFEHLGETRTRKVKLLSDTPAGGLTILEVSRHSLVQARASERAIIRTWAPICNTRGLHEIGRTRPRRL